MLIDRWFLAAAVIFLIMIPFTAIGLIHGTIEESVVQGRPSWQNVLTYSVSATACFFMHLIQKKGFVKAPELEDYRILQTEEKEELEFSGRAITSAPREQV